MFNERNRGAVLQPAVTPRDIRPVSADVLIQIDFLTVQTYPEESETGLYLSYGLERDYHLMPEIRRSRSLPKSNQLLFGMGSVCSGQFDRNPFISFRGMVLKERQWKKLTFLLKQDMVSVSVTVLPKFNFSLHLHVLFFYSVTSISTGHSVGTRRMKLGTEVEFVCVKVCVCVCLCHLTKRERGNGRGISQIGA